MEGLEADLRLEGLSPDDTLLISGPPMTGKYSLFMRILAGHTDNVVFISTKNGAERIVSDYRSVAADVREDRIGVIDCVSYMETMEDVTETDRIKYVQSPKNMTGIGVKFTELSDVFYELDGHAGVGLHSISQLVMHTETRGVYQFLQVLTGQIRSTGWLGVAVLDASIDDEEELKMLHHHFDGVVETRENDAGERQYRVRGLEPTATEWRGF